MAKSTQTSTDHPENPTLPKSQPVNAQQSNQIKIELSLLSGLVKHIDRTTGMKDDDMNPDQVEEWLDSHPDFLRDYFLRRGEFDLVNKWLVSNGFLSINDYVSSRRGSSSYGANNSTSGSPNSPTGDGPGGFKAGAAFFGLGQQLNPEDAKRNDSKKFLR